MPTSVPSPTETSPPIAGPWGDMCVVGDGAVMFHNAAGVENDVCADPRAGVDCDVGADDGCRAEFGIAAKRCGRVHRDFKALAGFGQTQVDAAPYVVVANADEHGVVRHLTCASAMVPSTERPRRAAPVSRGSSSRKPIGCRRPPCWGPASRMSATTWPWPPAPAMRIRTESAIRVTAKFAGRGAARLADALAGEDQVERAEQDLQVQHGRHVVDIPNIIGELLIP